MALPADIIETAREFALALEADPDGLIWRLATEPDPAEIPLVLRAGTPAGLSGDAAREASPGPGATGRAGEIPAANLPANMRCTLCADRMYPVRRFTRSGRQPALVLYFAGSFGKGPPKRDRSRELIFGTPEEDDLFARMLRAAGLAPEDLHYQEFPACHFNPVRSTPADWEERGRNCLAHVQDTVEREGVRLLLVTGPAAVALFGETRARELSTRSELAPLALGDAQMPALVLRSPGALLAMERKRERAREAGREQEMNDLVAEEKAVKGAMLAALKQAVRSLDESSAADANPHPPAAPHAPEP